MSHQNGDGQPEQSLREAIEKHPMPIVWSLIAICLVPLLELIISYEPLQPSLEIVATTVLYVVSVGLLIAAGALLCVGVAIAFYAAGICLRGLGKSIVGLLEVIAINPLVGIILLALCIAFPPLVIASSIVLGLVTEAEEFSEKLSEEPPVIDADET